MFLRQQLKVQNAMELRHRTTSQNWSTLFVGNYDEGFGREQHKTKWTGKSTDAAMHEDSPAQAHALNGDHEEAGERFEENAEQPSGILNGDMQEVTAEAQKLTRRALFLRQS